MMAFLATFLLTFILVSCALAFFLVRGSPVYRVERVNVISLLELVLAGEADDNDWQVFLAHPIRHDEQLADIQKRCIELTENDYLGRRGQLFSARGMGELKKMLEELGAEEPAPK